MTIFQFVIVLYVIVDFCAPDSARSDLFKIEFDSKYDNETLSLSATAIRFHEECHNKVTITFDERENFIVLDTLKSISKNKEKVNVVIQFYNKQHLLYKYDLGKLKCKQIMLNNLNQRTCIDPAILTIDAVFE